MGFLDRFRRQRGPTEEHLRRLENIKDPRQRAALLECIERGEQIPEFAWRDLPEVTPDHLKALEGVLPAIRERASQRGMDSAEYLASMAGYDAADVLQNAADQLNAASYLESEPINDVQPLETIPEEAVSLLFGWGIFNPYGPTMASLNLVDGPDGKLLFFSERHPLAQRDIVYGLIPHSLASNSKELASLLLELAARNGAEQHPLLDGSLPSHVYFPEPGTLTAAQVEVVFRRLAAHAAPEDLDSTAARVKRFKGRPWERASEELRAGFDEFRAVGTPEARGVKWPPDDPSWKSWWAAVTDREHVASEMAQMPAAWEGSKRFMRGDLEH